MPPKTERFEMRVQPELLRRIDKWRKKQSGEPSRAEAIRRLAHLGLVRPPQRTTSVEELRGEFYVRVREDGRVVSDYTAGEANEAAIDAEESGDTDLAILLRQRASEAKKGLVTEI